MCVVRPPTKSWYYLDDIRLMGKVKYFFLNSGCTAVFCSKVQRVAFRTAVSQLCLEVDKIFRRGFGKV